MILISSSAPRTAAPPAVREAERPAGVRSGSAPASQRPLKPVQDEYVPEGEKKRESYGRYWLGKDEDGGPKIYFDNPEAAEDAPRPPRRRELPKRRTQRKTRSRRSRRKPPRRAKTVRRRNAPAIPTRWTGRSGS